MIALRSALFNLWFFATCTVLTPYGVLLSWLAPRRVLELGVFWVRLVLGGLGVLCGIRPVLVGAENLQREGPALIASQHQSAFDTLVWMTLLQRPSYVLKQELTRIPLFGPLLLVAGMIAVDRRGGPSALRSMLRDADRAVAERRQIVIFPEGTRVAEGTRVKLHPGVAALAARTALPVIPVATDSGRRWGRRSFRKLPGPIRIVVLPPLPPGLSRETLMRELQVAWEEGAARLRTVDNSVG